MSPHICWSGRTEYDLSDRQVGWDQRLQQVLTEGTEGDARHYIDKLIEMREEVVLSLHVQAEWEAKFTQAQ